MNFDDFDNDEMEMNGSSENNRSFKKDSNPHKGRGKRRDLRCNPPKNPEVDDEMIFNPFQAIANDLRKNKGWVLSDVETMELSKRLDDSRHSFHLRVLRSDKVQRSLLRRCRRFLDNEITFHSLFMGKIPSDSRGDSFRTRLAAALGELEELLRRNRETYRIAVSHKNSPDDRANAWRENGKGRDQAAKLLEGFGFHWKVFLTFKRRLEEYSREVESLRRSSRKEARCLLRRIQETRGSLRHRVYAIQSAHTSFTEVRNRLIESNFRLLLASSKHCSQSGNDSFDRGQEAALALCLAAENFDARRGIRFTTYAISYLRYAIDNPSKNQNGIKLSSRAFTIRGKILNYIRDRQLTSYEKPTDEEIAKALGIPLKTVKKCLDVLSFAPESLDQEIKKDEETRFSDLLEDQTEEPAFHPMDLQLLREREDEVINLYLNPDEQKVIRLHFGFDGDPWSLEKIGKNFHLSGERIRQIKNNALLKLRRHGDWEGFRD